MDQSINNKNNRQVPVVKKLKLDKRVIQTLSSSKRSCDSDRDPSDKIQSLNLFKFISSEINTKRARKNSNDFISQQQQQQKQKAKTITTISQNIIKDYSQPPSLTKQLSQDNIYTQQSELLQERAQTEQAMNTSIDIHDQYKKQSMQYMKFIDNQASIKIISDTNNNSLYQNSQQEEQSEEEDEGNNKFNQQLDDKINEFKKNLIKKKNSLTQMNGKMSGNLISYQNQKAKEKSIKQISKGQFLTEEKQRINIKSEEDIINELLQNQDYQNNKIYEKQPSEQKTFLKFTRRKSQVWNDPVEIQKKLIENNTSNLTPFPSFKIKPNLHVHTQYLKDGAKKFFYQNHPNTTSNKENNTFNNIPIERQQDIKVRGIVILNKFPNNKLVKSNSSQIKKQPQQQPNNNSNNNNNDNNNKPPTNKYQQFYKFQKKQEQFNALGGNILFQPFQANNYFGLNQGNISSQTQKPTLATDLKKAFLNGGYNKQIVNKNKQIISEQSENDDSKQSLEKNNNKNQAAIRNCSISMQKNLLKQKELRKQMSNKFERIITFKSQQYQLTQDKDRKLLKSVQKEIRPKKIGLKNNNNKERILQTSQINRRYDNKTPKKLSVANFFKNDSMQIKNCQKSQFQGDNFVNKDNEKHLYNFLGFNNNQEVKNQAYNFNLPVQTEQFEEKLPEYDRKLLTCGNTPSQESYFQLGDLNNFFNNIETK